MPILYRVRGRARLLALFILAGLCNGPAAAMPEPPQQFAALAPAYEALTETPPVTRAPFGLSQSALAAAPAAAMSAKWQNLQPVMRIEAQAMALCRAQPDACAPATARFLSIVEAARNETGRARIGIINRAINLAIRPVRDFAQFNVPDVWMSPLMTLKSGSGDCEDYAIAKYVALRETGMSAADLRLMIVHDRSINEDHAVTAARVDGEWLILDSRHLVLLTDRQVVSLTPLIALGSDEEPATLIRDAGLDARLMPQAMTATA